MGKLTQQSVLHNAMRNLSWSRNKLASFLKIDIQKLDAWLLSKDAQGFQLMDLRYQDDVFQKLRAKEIKDSDIPEGTTSASVPIIYCDLFNFDFPTLYRVTYEFQGIDLITGEPDLDQNFIEYGYSLTDKPVHSATNATTLKVEPVRARTRTNSSDSDTGWIYISEHNSIEHADAYLDAALNFLLAPKKLLTVEKYHFEGRIFTLVHADQPSGECVKERLTIYMSDQYLALFTPTIKGLSYSYIGTKEWELVIDKDGCTTDRYDNWDGSF